METEKEEDRVVRGAGGGRVSGGEREEIGGGRECGGRGGPNK